MPSNDSKSIAIYTYSFKNIKAIFTRFPKEHPLQSHKAKFQLSLLLEEAPIVRKIKKLLVV
jgi:hypothetical protein